MTKKAAEMKWTAEAQAGTGAETKAKAEVHEAGNAGAVAESDAKAQAESDKKANAMQYVPDEAPAAASEEALAVCEGDKYLNSGAHIGTKFKSGDMRKYIYKTRKDGLKVLDVQTLDDRLKLAAKFIAHYPKDKVVVVSRRAYGQTPAKIFAQSVGGTAIVSRFVPGTFTNPECTHYIEPAAVIVVDPEVDNQAIEEATNIRVPVVGMASTNNSLKNIDIAIPINNKGKKSLALAFWVLSKEILRGRGEIKSDDEFTKKVDDFEYKLKEGEEEEQRKMFERRQGQRGRYGDRREGREGRENRGGFGSGGRRFGGERRSFGRRN